MNRLSTDKEIMIGKSSFVNNKSTLQNKLLHRVLHYFKTYEEIFGSEKAEQLLADAKDNVDMVLDSLDKEL